VAVSIGRKCWGGRRGRWAKLLRGERTLRRVFNDVMLRDTMASLLVPCYDLATAAPSDAAPARHHGAHISEDGENAMKKVRYATTSSWIW